MTTNTYTKATITIADLCRDPEGIIQEARNAPVAIVNQHGASTYLVPADIFEAMLDVIEDAELAEIVNERRGDPTVKVKLDDL